MGAHGELISVGLWKGGLVVLQDGKPRAVGKSQQNHNLLPITARLIEGERLAVQSVRVEMKGRTLRWLLGKIDQRRVTSSTGKCRSGKSTPSPISTYISR